MAGKSNMELLQRDENRLDRFLAKWWTPAVLSAIGLVTVAHMRYNQGRPLLSGIQTYILTVVGCSVAGYQIHQYRDGVLAERDAVLRNYLERHPEDFPDPERKKFAEILRPWVPIR
ncbi:NADH dehydrogenase [ubiquinone] 1 subunit C2 [Zootermopsis nevadensis]|uniref:NADH dehydrogenase [ubiquinone] 1 subunit C2 n=1 Tax=Zootermopsis nevadensis TaxID=136037 RepID=A0A067RFC4_ZOONE|nr:NADH dehydrogenase [ubiquinone] 1 subunit C2 [Zootermopsis nevadensis]KDR18848.1 NADH dehydrogenase [ubiquinone] 1 subunit C2 [Zootermopsis nevadensis]